MILTSVLALTPCGCCPHLCGRRRRPGCRPGPGHPRPGRCPRGQHLVVVVLVFVVLVFVFLAVVPVVVLTAYTS